MLLESSIVVHRPPDVVSAYLADTSKVSHWDRGVSRTEGKSEAAPGVGFEFDTLAHARGNDKQGEWGRMSYRIKEIDPVRGCTVELTGGTGNARFFKSAEWRFRVDADPAGAKVHCVADFKVKWRYFFMAAILYFMKSAIRRDLEGLKQRVESEVPENGEKLQSA
ncbi:MAG: SRPBCC family protein [Terracidiphilus sp.]